MFLPTQASRKPGVRQEMLEGLPKEIEEYVINEEDTCSKCGSPLTVIRKEVVRTEVEFKPARLIVKQIVRQIAKCIKCGTDGSDGSDNPNQHFEKTAIPVNVLSHSIATPSLVGHILQQKYGMGIPLNRMKKELYSMGLVASRAALDAFWSWCKKTGEIPTTNEKLTKALNYASGHKAQLETFLEDGRLEISNNLCESHIRPFATGRRSWLFAGTPKGATASAVAYTLAESAKANELNIYEYFRHILVQMPNNDFHNHPEEIDRLLPWSDELPKECQLAQKHKNHLKK